MLFANPMTALLRCASVEAQRQSSCDVSVDSRQNPFHGLPLEIVGASATSLRPAHSQVCSHPVISDSYRHVPEGRFFTISRFHPADLRRRYPSDAAGRFNWTQFHSLTEAQGDAMKKSGEIVKRSVTQRVKTSWGEVVRFSITIQASR